MQTNYVLIHGAWHGSWCFEKHLIPYMLKKNPSIKIQALNLPGHYTNNQHHFSSINFSCYVDYVTEFITKYIQGRLVLVGHSMGGMVISQVAENLASKINHLVYVAAFLPQNNQSLADLESKTRLPSVSIKIRLEEEKCTIHLSPQDCHELFYQKCKAQDIKYALNLIQPQPIKPFLAKVNLSKNFQTINKTYIQCLQDKAIHIKDQRAMSLNCQHIKTLDTDHSPFFSRYQELGNILLQSPYLP